MAKGKDWISCRDVLWYMVFSGCAVNYMIKICMNLIIVATVIPKKTRASIAQCALIANSSIWTNGTAPDFTASYASSTSIPEEIDYSDKFDWSEYEQGLILGAFYWLYWATQVPGGLLGQRFGAKRIFGGGNLLAAFITLLFPFAMKYSFTILIFLRCLQGFIMGVMYPSMHGLPTKWVPPNKTSKFVTAYVGGSFGTALTYPFCAMVIYYFSWEAAFYVTSGIGFVWFVFWCYLVYDTPQEHPRISKEELEYLIKNTPPSSEKENKRPVPWAEIFSSMPVWMTIIAHWGITWGFYTLLAQTPSYFNYIHGWDINMTGVLSGAPHLTLIAFAYGYSLLSDWLLKTKKMSRTNVRKMATVVASGIQAVMIIGLSLSGCSPTLAVVFMVLGTSVTGALSSATIANYVDLSPNYASVLFGISGLITNAAGIMSPMIVGILTNNNQTIEQWRLVFLIAAANLLVTCVAYVIWGTSDEQKWNNYARSDTELGEELQKMKIDTDANDETKKEKRKDPLISENA